MQPRITVIALGVDDLDRAVNFYRDGRGLKTEGVIGREFEDGAVARDPDGHLWEVVWNPQFALAD